MVEQLQGLLDRIQREGVEKAEVEAERIQAEAQERAADIIGRAEAEAKSTVEEAEREADALTQRGQRALEQAARDVVLSVRDAVNDTLSALVNQDVTAAFDKGATLKLLAQVIDAYCKDRTGNAPIDVLVSPKLNEEISSHFLARLSAAAHQGLEIKPDGTLISGFRIALVDDKLEHDFSSTAIANALCQILRPHLAKIVKDAVENQA